MELKDFIMGVISDVTNAISECQNLLNNGSIISPSNVKKTDNGVNSKDGYLSVSNIDFEVSVFAGEVTESECRIGGKIQVLGLTISTNGGNDNKYTNEHISKVKFSVPVIYPVTKVQEKPRTNIL